MPPPRAFRWLLRLFPGSFRRRHGDDMAAAFADRLAAAGRERGLRGRLGVWARTLPDLLASAWRERRRREAGPGVRERLRDDLRQARRALGSRPLLTLVVVLTLALGIGANTAVFSVVQEVILEPLPYDEPERLVRVWSRNPGIGHDRYFVAPVDFLEFEARNRSLEGMAAFFRSATTLRLRQGPERVTTGLVSADLFRLLGVEPLHGRLFRPEDANRTVAVLSHGLWTSRFGGDPSVVGSTIDLGAAGGGGLPVVGVLPPGLEYAPDVRLWLPLVNLGSSPARTDRWLDVVARLREGVSPTAALRDLASIQAGLREADPARHEGWRLDVEPLHEVLVGDSRPVLLTLLAASGVILLIACANVAGLLLAAGEGRRREMALRAALGAGRRRIASLLLVESVLLALAGVLAGLAVAWAAVRGLVALGSARLPRLAGVGLDGEVLAFAVGSGALVGLAFGVLPALRLADVDLARGPREGARGATGGPGPERLRAAFVVAQVALSVMLVIGAGLLARSLVQLLQVDPGFHPESAVFAEVSLGPVGYPDHAAVSEFYAELCRRLREQPGVVAAGAGSMVPLQEHWDYPSAIYRADRPRPPAGQEVRPYFRQVTPGYFAAMGMELARGRAFSPRDDADGAGVVVVNEAMAELFWPDGGALGSRLRGAAQTFGPLGAMLLDEVEVVGVVGDARYADLRAPARPSVYFPHRQAPFRRMSVVVRTTEDAGTAIGRVRRAVAGIDPELAVSRASTLRELVAGSVGRDRFGTLLLGLFGTLAVGLASVGLYGTVAQAVARRTREIGVRVALGAGRGRVLWWVLRRVLSLVGTGLLLGGAGGLWMAGLLQGLLYDVSPADPVAFLSASGVLLLVSLLAAAAPIRRALRVDPVAALRAD